MRASGAGALAAREQGVQVPHCHAEEHWCGALGPALVPSRHARRAPHQPLLGCEMQSKHSDWPKHVHSVERGSSTQRCEHNSPHTSSSHWEHAMARSHPEEQEQRSCWSHEPRPVHGVGLPGHVTASACEANNNNNTRRKMEEAISSREKKSCRVTKARMPRGIRAELTSTTQ